MSISARSVLLASLSIGIASLFILTLPAQAITTTVTLRPNADSYNSGGGWTGSGGSGCSLLYCRTNEISASTAEYTTYSSASTQYFALTGPPYIGQGTTEFRLRIYASSAAGGFLNTIDSLQSRAQYGATAINNGTDILLPAAAWRNNAFSTTGVNSYNWYEQAQAGSWTKPQLDDAVIGFTRQSGGGAFSSAEEQRIAASEVVVTYTKQPLWSQTNYRIYQASSSTTPGTALATGNTGATLQNQGDAFRIRMGLAAGETAWNAGFGSYKLQYAVKTGSCSASTYGDVQSASGAIRWFNDTPADGSAIGSYALDPSGTKAYQTYRESNNFTNSNSAALNSLALWDFSLKDFSGSPGTVYCFRIVKDDEVVGFEPVAYANYPEVQAVGTLDTWFVNTAQATLSGPSIPFTSRYILTHQCQTSVSQTPAGGLYLRVNNDLATNGWTATIAPTLGPSAQWRNGPDTSRYDFNDPAGSPAGCFSGSDGDLYAGQMTVSASGTSVSRQRSGCSTTGLSAGVDASFSEGATDNITLLTAGSSSQRFCWWDISGYGITQTIPAATPDGIYTLDMTVTVTAS